MYNIIASHALSGNFVIMLRLVRLLRVLKLLTFLEGLRIIIEAVFLAVKQAFYTSIILFLYYYLFAVLGEILYASNDPFHFGTLHQALFSLFDSSTLDNYSGVMFTGMYGCSQYAGNMLPGQCDPSESVAQPTVSILFWTFFVFIGSLT